MKAVMYPLPIIQTPVVNPVTLGMLFMPPFPIHESARRAGKMSEDDEEKELFPCTKCGEEKPAKDYYTKKATDVRYKHCIACHVAMKKDKKNRAESNAAIQAQLIAALQAGKSKTQDIADFMHADRNSTYERLIRMEAAGKVRRAGIGKNFRWEVVR